MRFSERIKKSLTPLGARFILPDNHSPMNPKLMNWYDIPRYYDIAFQGDTKQEATFIEQTFQQYARVPVTRILEPACGGGRLILELAKRGHDLVGFDQSSPAIRFAQQRLRRHGLEAELFVGEMANFQLSRPAHGAYNLCNTFRHLLTEQAARQHLEAVSRHLPQGGIYILGLHLLPLDVDESCIERWSETRRGTKVTVTLRVTETNRRQRWERIRVSLLVRGPQGEKRFRDEFQLRMYTADQFRRLIRNLGNWEICDVFDFWYDIGEPLKLNDEITDSVFILRKTD
jgi:SAM-dependent methyltransferase